MALTLRFFTTIAAITFALATNAQLVDKKSLTLEAAQKIAAASLAEARANWAAAGFKDTLLRC